MSIGLNIIMYFTLHVTYYNAGIVFHLIRNKKVTENLSRYLHNTFYIPNTFALAMIYIAIQSLRQTHWCQIPSYHTYFFSFSTNYRQILLVLCNTFWLVNQAINTEIKEVELFCIKQISVRLIPWTTSGIWHTISHSIRFTEDELYRYLYD